MRKNWHVICCLLGQGEKKAKISIGCQFFKNLDLLVDLGKIDIDLHSQVIRNHIGECDECRAVFEIFYGRYVEEEAEETLQC